MAILRKYLMPSTLLPKKETHGTRKKTRTIIKMIMRMKTRMMTRMIMVLVIMRKIEDQCELIIFRLKKSDTMMNSTIFLNKPGLLC